MSNNKIITRNCSILRTAKSQPHFFRCVICIYTSSELNSATKSKAEKIVSRRMHVNTSQTAIFSKNLPYVQKTQIYFKIICCLITENLNIQTPGDVLFTGISSEAQDFIIILFLRHFLRFSSPLQCLLCSSRIAVLVHCFLKVLDSCKISY